MSAILWVGCIALLLIAGGLELWRRGHVQARRHASAEFAERQMAYAVPRTATDDPIGRLMPQRKPRPWEFFFERAGVIPTPGFYARLVGLWLLLAVVALLFSGILAAFVVAVLFAVLVYFRYWFKASKRYQAIVRQLPPFLDNMVRLLTIGNSLGAAFQAAAGNTEAPLRDLLASAVRQVQAGAELDASLRQVARVHGIEELFLFSAVVDLSMRFGGRADQVLARMAGFMRDREQAQQELIAMSSETRMSAWVLALLPVCVSGFLMVTNPAFFEPMLTQPTGQKILLTGLVLECVGGFALYKLAKSI